MLFCMKHIGGAEPNYLIDGREYTIGRKRANIIIDNDESISKKHAVIKIQNKSAYLQDRGSRYGTKHNNSKLDPQKTVLLEHNDSIQFGLYKSIYKFQKVNIVTTSSGLSDEQKSQLKSKVTAVGGSLVNNCNANVTHVTAQEIMLTVKVLHAIIDDIPIVTPEFWDKFKENLKDMKPPPDCNSFKPPVSEALINGINLSPNPARKKVFKNKTFVFPTEKLRLKMASVIERAGGSSISWTEQPLTLLQVAESENKYLFIKTDDQNRVPQSLKDIHEHLEKLGERTIPIVEIAQAILFYSCEKDCNPKYNRIHHVFVNHEVSTSSEMFLAGETPSEEVGVQNVETKQEIVIPESLEDDWSLPQRNKEENNIMNVGRFLAGPSTSNTDPSRNCSRPSKSFACPTTSSAGVTTFMAAKRGDQEPEGNPPKKIKLNGSPQEPKQESRKRKADESLQSTCKKSPLRQNPFAIIKSKVPCHKAAGDNPFVALRMKKEARTSVDNPFMLVREENSMAIEQNKADDSKMANTNPDKTASSDVSFSQSYSTSDSSNIKWFNRKESKCGKIEIDPELNDIYEKFRNSVVIEVLPAAALRSLDASRINITINTTTSGRNFKKFKKIRPLKPQINIITTSILCNNTNEVTVLSDREEEDEDEYEEEEMPRPIVPKKANRKRFNF